MSRIELEPDIKSRQQIAGVASLFGGAAGAIVCTGTQAHPFIGAIVAFLLCMALSVYSRGLGITLIIVCLFIIIGRFSGTGN